MTDPKKPSSSAAEDREQAARELAEARARLESMKSGQLMLTDAQRAAVLLVEEAGAIEEQALVIYDLAEKLYDSLVARLGIEYEDAIEAARSADQP